MTHEERAHLSFDAELIDNGCQRFFFATKSAFGLVVLTGRLAPCHRRQPSCRSYRELFELE
jgi:hypothetical protein